RGFSELMGYAALYNIGCTLALLGLGGQAAVLTILVNLTVRALALVLIAVSTSTLYLRAASDGFSYVSGMVREMPFAAAGLIIGGLTLAGTPFTAGFAPYWQLLRSATADNPNWVIFLVLGGLGVAVGYLRGLWALLGSDRNGDPASKSFSTNILQNSQEPRFLMMIIVVVAFVCILIGLFPALLIDLLRDTARHVSWLIQ
ncbi:MAG: hypothetical protein KDI79_29870, partial [Anaerolineae bacterium]|nr:hypothetical protein [Anaerolineae bacterium]